MGVYMIGQKNKNEVIVMIIGMVVVEFEEGKLLNGKSLVKVINCCLEQGSSMVVGMFVLSILELVKKQGKVVGVVMMIEFIYVIFVVIYVYICYCDV